MNSEEVIKVIDVLCDKLGIAVNSAKDFVPALAKYQIVSNIFDSVMSVLIIAISIVVIRKAFESAEKKMKKERETGVSSWSSHDSVWYFWYTWLASIIGGIAILMSVCLFMSSVHDVLVWSISPEASAIKYVLNILNDI